MNVAIVTLDSFNEIDSLVVLHMLNRASDRGGRAELTCPAEAVQSMNGVHLTAQRPLEFTAAADAVVIGSGRRTLELVEDHTLMSRLALDPRRQLIAAQCSGALVLAKLGILRSTPACTDLKTRPHLVAAGVDVLDRAFHAAGNVATAGGCLATQYLATWLLWRLFDRSAAEAALRYVAPVGELESTVTRALATVEPYL